MKKNFALFALGFATAYAIPLSRAIIVGLHHGISMSEDDFREYRKNLDTPDPA
jgi:hypothetical protein